MPDWWLDWKTDDYDARLAHWRKHRKAWIGQSEHTSNVDKYLRDYFFVEDRIENTKVEGDKANIPVQRVERWAAFAST